MFNISSSSSSKISASTPALRCVAAIVRGGVRVAAPRGRGGGRTQTTHTTVTATATSSASASTSSSSASASASASNTQTASAPPSMTMVPFLSKRNEEETYALIAGYMDAAVHKAKKGAQEALQIKASLLETSSSLSSSTTTILQHGIMADYLMRRARTLQNSLDRINVLLEHPQVFQAQEHALMLHQQQQQ